MATTTSLLQSPRSLSSSFPPRCYLPSSNIPTNQTTLNIKSQNQSLKSSPLILNHPKRNTIRKTSAETVTAAVETSAETVTAAVENLITNSSELKIKLLSAVSGLNRGLAANEEDLEKADAAAKELEAAGGIVDLSEGLDKLQGRWKLIYSSGFSSRTLGGSRPGPSLRSVLPITLGQVFQRIDIFSKDFDNIVELQLGAPWPLQPIEATATLAHKFELTGSAKIKIKFEKTTVKTTGNLSQLPLLELPQIPDGLRPQSNTGSGEFEITYLDKDTRITRGDRGELRVFVIA